MPSQSSQDTPLHKIPPQNLEAEKSVLGGILLDNTAINRVLEVLGGNGEDFYRDAHKKIFRTMVALLEKDTAIDVITLTDALKTAGLIDPIGGASYIAALADSVPTAANITYYARIVREKAVLRRLITAATDIVTRGFDGGENVDEFLDDAERIILQASEDKIKQSFYHVDDCRTSAI